MKTTYSSGARYIEAGAWDEEEDVHGDFRLDGECVVIDEESRWLVYSETWTVLPEEKRLDLQNHARIAGAENVESGLQGLDDLCTLFDDGDGYEDASIDLGNNRLGTMGVEDGGVRKRRRPGAARAIPSSPPSWGEHSHVPEMTLKRER